MGFIVKKTTFVNPIDLVMPHTCRGCGRIGEPLCEYCKKNIILEHQNLCPNCKSTNPTGICPKCSSLPPIFTVADRNTVIGDLVHDYKYQSVRALGKILSQLADNILPSIIGNVAVVPLPTIARHVRERGFDHTFEIARHLCKARAGWTVWQGLERANNSVQVGATESMRLAQAKKAYEVNSNCPIEKETTYLLLDDVWTTGASMKAAYKKMSSAGADKTIMLVLAVSQFGN